MDESNMALLELTAFLASSARGVVDEPPLYGSFRLIDAIQRSIRAIKNASGHRLDKFFDEISEFIEKNKYKVMNDRKGYVAFIDELVVKVTKKAKNELKIQIEG